MTIQMQDQVQPQPHGEWAVEDISTRRKLAYANPSSGSDGLFAEARRMKDMGESGWEEVQARAIQRYEEIKFSLPWPNI